MTPFLPSAHSLFLVNTAYADEFKIYDVDKRSENRYDVCDIEAEKHYDVEVDENDYGTLYDIEKGDIRPLLIHGDMVLDVETGNIYYRR